MLNFFCKKKDCESFPKNLFDAIGEITTFERPRKITQETLVSVNYALSLLDSGSEMIVRCLYENNMTHKEVAIRNLCNERAVRVIEMEALRTLSSHKILSLLEQGITSWVGYTEQLSYDAGKKEGYCEGFVQGISTTRDKDYNPYTNYELLDSSIKFLDLTPKCFEILENMNCRKIGDLLRYDKKDILDAHGVGPATARMIAKGLTRFGLSHTAWSDAYNKREI